MLTWKFETLQYFNYINFTIFLLLPQGFISVFKAFVNDVGRSNFPGPIASSFLCEELAQLTLIQFYSIKFIYF